VRGKRTLVIICCASALSQRPTKQLYIPNRKFKGAVNDAENNRYQRHYGKRKDI
jgi:hypothetical protein